MPFRLLYILRGGRIERLRAGQGNFPDELFYGYCQLARHDGWKAELIIRSFPSKLGFCLQQAVHRLTNLAPDFSNAGTLNAALLRRYDVILSMSEPVLLMLALQRRNDLKGAALVLILIGAEKRLKRSHVPPLTQRMMRWLLGQTQAVIVLGEGERDYLLDHGLVDEDRLHLIQFGVDIQYWRPVATPTSGSYVLSLGNDDGRDYETLLRAIGQHPLRLHTALPVDSRLWPPNVTYTKGDWIGQALSDAALRELYQASRFVVIPLKESSQPQGQSVALQAMACGKAVILSRTRGLWSKDLMKHLENCYLVPSGDVTALQEAIDHLSRDTALCARLGHAARASVERHFSSDLMARRIAAILEPIKADVSQRRLNSESVFAP